jgi:hypothetical protein
MGEHRAWGGWRAAVAVAVVVAGAWLAVALVANAVGAVGNDPVVTDPGPPPSVDAFRDDQRERYRNVVTNRVFAFAPLVVPVVGAFAGFVAVAGRRDRAAAVGGGEYDGGVREGGVRGGGLRDAVGVAARVGVGAAVGCAVGYALFVAVGTQAYAAVPGGYVLESYPPTVSVAGVATNALGVSAPTGVGAFLAAFAAAGVATRDGLPGATEAADASDPDDGTEVVDAGDPDDATEAVDASDPDDATETAEAASER